MKFKSDICITCGQPDGHYSGGFDVINDLDQALGCIVCLECRRRLWRKRVGYPDSDDTTKETEFFQSLLDDPELLYSL